MTTNVKIHVNGRYRAKVQQDGNLPVVVHGNYEGSPNPSGEHTVYVCHPANTIISIAEEQVPEAPVSHPDTVVSATEAPAADAETKPAPDEADQNTI